MPILKINDDRIASVSELVSQMVYPQNLSKQLDFYRKVSFHLYLREKENLQNCAHNKEYVNYINKVCSEYCYTMAPKLLYAESFYAVMKKKLLPVKLPIVGKIVQAMVVFNEIGVEQGQKRVSQYIISMNNTTGLKLSAGSLDSAWGKYKTVSHLWAAYADVMPGALKNDGLDDITVIFMVHYEKILSYSLFYQEFLLNYKSNNNRRVDISRENLLLIPENKATPIRPSATIPDEDEKAKIKKWCRNEYPYKNK